MIAMIRKFLDLAGARKKQLYLAWLFQALTSICEGAIYFMLFLAIKDILGGSFTREKLIQYSLMFLVYTVLHFVFYYFTIAKQRPVSYAMMRDERLSIAAKIKQFPLYYFTKDKISQLTSLFTTDLSFVEMNIMEIIAGFVSSMIMTVVFALMLLSVDWRMALLLFVGIIPGYILYQQFQKSMVQLGEQKKNAQVAMIDSTLEYVQGMETIKAYRLEQSSKLVEKQVDGYCSASDRYEATLTNWSMGYKICLNLALFLSDTVDDGQAIQNLIQQLNEAGDAAENTADDVGQIAENTKGAALMQAADQLSAVGDKIQEIGDKALDAYTDTENAVTKVNAYFGETGQAAEQSANVIKNVYSSGVGESMDAVANAVLMVKKNLGDLSETDLTNLTQQAITLEELYGIDMNETLRGVNSLMQQYGLTAQEAMDYIVVGTQNGLDKTNELGDNLSEYAGKFAQAGYSASEYFQLLDNGLKNGAYNLDKVNDAINEVTTRLVDGTIGESIGMFSTKTQELFTSWQNGGATQKQVIDSIVADIAGCTNQQEALNLAALAFGTMAEDGNLKFITSLTSVGSTYDSVKGSAQGLFDATTTPMQEMESNTRKLQQSLVPLGEKLAEIANTILPPLVAVIQTVSRWFAQLPGPVQNFIVILGVLLAAFTALTPVIAALAVSVGALNISLLPIIAVIAAVAAAIAGIIAIIQNWGAITEWFGNLWNTICIGIGTMIESVKTWFSNLWTHLQNVWNGICNVVQTAVMLIGSIIQGAVDIITLPFRFIWENCKDIVTSVWNGIKNTVSSVLSAISGVISSIMGAIQNVISSIWNAISSKVSAVVNAIKNTVTSVFNAIKSVASTVWNGIKSVISTVVDGIKSKVSSVFNAVKSTVSSVFNGIKSTATTVWNGIKTAITKPIEAAKNTIKGIVDKISGFFSGMKLELPKIKLPHFKITGKLSLAPPSVPHLSIDWYKEGGILTKPTIFGMNGSSMMAGGEAGREAVLPLKGFYNQLENILSSRMNTSAMEKYLAIIAENSCKGLYLDDGTLVGHLLPAIDSGLGKTQKLQRRLSL